jgi:flagellar motor switch protein FliM
VESLGSFQYRIILSVNGNNSTSSFPICIPFISFSYLISLTKNSRTVLNKDGEREREREDTLVSFFTSEGTLSVFPHLVLCQL